MNTFKRIFASRGSKVWAIVSISVIALMLTVTILASTVFYNFLIITPLGGERVIYADGREPSFAKETASKEDALAQANALNEELAGEGMVLLKNEDALPLAKGDKVSVFGKNSVNLVYGGSGSGGGNNASAKTIYDSLEAAGFHWNDTLKRFYENAAQSGEKRPSNPSDLDSGGNKMLTTAETPYAKYNEFNIPSSYAEYSDAALIVLSRIGGEGFDLPRVSSDDADRHYLELDPNEQDLIRNVCGAGFKKVIVLINSSNNMELGWAKDDALGKIDGVLFLGGPGNTGIMALGRILNGELSPSGRTVDTWSADFTKDPTWNNFGDNRVEKGDRYVSGGKDKQYYFVDYEEGVYVGYRYYETRGLTDGEDWYRSNVVYPFGYGLGYTDFSWEITSFTEPDKSGKGSVTVTVTNTGEADAKDVVELYATAPYTEGGIEKPYKVLIGFAKTPLLYPASEADLDHPSSAEVTIAIDLYDVASYDATDANHNGFAGYELDGGIYTFHVAKNAHETVETRECNVEAVRYERDPVTGYEVTNRFDDADAQLSGVLSRMDWEGTWPTSPTVEERTVSASFISSLNDRTPNNPNVSGTMPTTDAEATVVLWDMVRAPYDDPRWETLLNALTVSEMGDLFNNGTFQTAAVLKIGKPKTTDADGPVGFVNFMGDPSVYDTCSYCSEALLASGWNTEAMQKMGNSVGEEGLWGNVQGDGAPYSGWYAPAVNIHRSPFGGRNFEYFSEDPFLAGMMASYEIRGAMEKGVYTHVKHFAVNEQETHRSNNGLCTYITEQALREVYLRAFELTVKVGGTHGMMSSFNRIGTKWTGGDYRLLTEVLRNEWGFQGAVICDFNTNSYMDGKQMAYAGGDINLTTTRPWTYDAGNASDVNVLREAAKHILFTVANSNAMNAEVIGYRAPVWQISLFVADGVIAVLIAIWGVFAIRGSLKKSKEQL